MLSSVEEQVVFSGDPLPAELGETFVAGVLGGMGPASSAEFCRRLVRATSAQCDQDHMKVVMWSDPCIPDRSAHLTGVGPSPVPALLDGLRKLSVLGASVVTIVCNTAHAYLPTLRQHATLPILDMVGSTARRCYDIYGPGARIGLLGTTGTLATGVYDEALGNLGLTAVHPLASAQENVMTAITLVKSGDSSGRARDLLNNEASNLAARNVTAIIFACTEVGVAFGDQLPPVDALDPMDVTAQILIGMRSCYRAGSPVLTNRRADFERMEG